ncbi:MAG: signal recognition particle protein [Rhodospirillales bacterium]
MFDSLTGKLGEILERLRKRAALGPQDVDEALRAVRVALLEADVALPVVKDFIARTREKAMGQEVLRSVTPGQMVIKIVHDELVRMLDGDGAADERGGEVDLNAPPPVVVLMVGLQGSGKTTTTAKLGLRLAGREKKKVLMASLDTQRPAAQEQLAVLGLEAGVKTLPVVQGQPPLDIAKRALIAARLEGCDVVLLDTAGRLQIDDALMAEVKAVSDLTRPRETLLVADAMTGQDAVNVARGFNEKLGLTGIVLTRVDGDARGGAALSMRAVTGKPIKLIGVGERLDALEPFHAGRVAGRILGMGDVVGLVEKAAATIEREDAEKLALKAQKGQLDMDDLANQLRQMRKMGGLSSMMGMLPGIGQMQKQIASAKIDDGLLKRQEAIIQSMTKKERRNVKLLNASRRRRIAAGSGTTVQDVNRLVKQFDDMSRMMKQMGKLGQKGMMRHGLAGLGIGRPR